MLVPIEQPKSRRRPSYLRLVRNDEVAPKTAAGESKPRRRLLSSIIALTTIDGPFDESLIYWP